MNKKNEKGSSGDVRHAFLLTWKEGNPPYKFEKFKQLETWRFRSHKQAKLGDEIYLLKQGKNNPGIFGYGVIIKSPYSISEAVKFPSGWARPPTGELSAEEMEKKTWVVDIRIDEIVDPSKELFLTLNELKQLHPPAGLWFTQSSGIKIPDDVAEAIRSGRQWKSNGTLPIVELEEDSETSYKAWVEARIGQQRFREDLLQYWEGCSVTGCSFQEVLVASHIVPWSKSSNKERLDPYNGLLLTPNLDRLFDSYLISFNQSGEIIISESINSETMLQLAIAPAMKLRKVAAKHRHFLQQHENTFREKEQLRGRGSFP